MKKAELVLFLALVPIYMTHPAYAVENEKNQCLSILEEGARAVVSEDFKNEEIADVEPLREIDDLHCHEEEKMVNTAIVVRFGNQTIKFAVFHLHLTKEGAPHPLMPPREWKSFTKETLRWYWCEFMTWQEKSLKEQNCR